MQIPEAEWRSLSHRQRRVLVNKERRRRKRQAAALKREEEKAALESQPGYLERLAAEEKLEEERRHKEEAQRLLEHEAWVEREKIAQEQFRLKREKDEKEKREREERERLIREEWELLQKKEKEAKEKKEKLRQQKEVMEHLHRGQERLQEALATENRPSAEKPTHNPLAPEGYTEPNEKNYGTEKDSRNCPFFLKTGACRFGDTCSRLHPRPASSTTILIPAMYSSLGLTEWGMNDRDDSALEYDEGDMYEHFRSFYEDVFPEFTSVGKVVQFKVACNYEPHLRGNVYVQYQSEEECAAAYRKFNGRWYAQRQLSCQFCPVQRWRNAICGLYSQKRCPKGKHCNFLHVFQNPGGAFCRADRDLPPLSPPSRRSSRHERRRRSRSRSRSRDRHRRSHSRERNSEDHRTRRRGRSRSRERRRRSRSQTRSSHSSRSRRHSRSTTRRRERKKRGRDSSESEKDQEKNLGAVSTRNSETFTRMTTTEPASSDTEQSVKHKKKKKKKKRSDDSLSPSSSSSKRRHHKHGKHGKRKREGSNSREPAEEKFDGEGTTKTPAQELEENQICKDNNSSEQVENCDEENITVDSKGSPGFGPLDSDPSTPTLDSLPQHQASPLLEVSMKA